MDGTAERGKLSGQLYDPREFLTMLDHLSASELGIGFVYAALDLLARQYHLADVVVVIGDEALGTQAFRLGRKSVSGDTLASVTSAPGVFSDPDVVPDVVQDVVRSVCQLALSLHLARHGTDRKSVTSLANRQYFEATLRTAAAQSSRYGWVFTLVLADVSGIRGTGDPAGDTTSGERLSNFGLTLRRSVRSGDTAARIKRDQFAIILWNAEGTDVLAFTERLRSMLMPGSEHMAFTIGTSTSPGDSADPVELLRLAHARLSQNKGTAPR